MRILIACEESGVVRDAFIKRGHDAMSCDLLPTAIPGPHYQGDVFDVIDQGWDAMIGFPPCTYIAACQWWRCQRDPNRMKLAQEGLRFFGALWNANIPLIALENPRSMASTRVAPKSQTIHPYEFGHPEFKTTWLWLKGFPKLKPTSILDRPEKGTEEYSRWEKVWRMGPAANRSQMRSRTYTGIAEAMADQWGGIISPSASDIENGLDCLSQNKSHRLLAEKAGGE